MYVSSINSLMSFKQTQKKYEQPSVREQLPSMVLGAIVGGIGGTVYGCTKNLKGKKLGWCIADSAAGCAILVNIIYLITHPPKKISPEQTDKPINTQIHIPKNNDSNNIAFN